MAREITGTLERRDPTRDGQKVARETNRLQYDGTSTKLSTDFTVCTFVLAAHGRPTDYQRDEMATVMTGLVEHKVRT